MVFDVAYFHLLKATLMDFFFCEQLIKGQSVFFFRVILQFSFLKDGWQVIFSFIREWKIAAAVLV